MVATELKKQVIDFDTFSFEKYTKIQNETKEAFEVLKDLYKQVLGDLPIRCYKEYLEDSTTYLINAWFEANSKYYPPNTIPQRAFLVVDVEAEDISYACTRFNNLCKQLDQHAPVIKSDGIRWKLKKESFNKTLNPEHEAHYKAVEDFLASAKVLKEFEPYNHDFHLNRFSDSIRMVGLELVIEKTKFY